MHPSKLKDLSASYLTALHAHVDGDAESGLPAALALGERAVSLGMEMLDVAKLHDRVLPKLILPEHDDDKRATIDSRAMSFFNEAIRPIENTHRTALKANAKLDRLNTSLIQRTDELAQAKEDVRTSIKLSTTASDSLKSSMEESARLLKDSRELEEQLRQIARDILTDGEEERKKLSLQLHDEISQTMLGIHIRLVALKQEVTLNHTNLTDEIATTQRLVDESVTTINSFARNLGIPNEG